LSNYTNVQYARKAKSGAYVQSYYCGMEGSAPVSMLNLLSLVQKRLVMCVGAADRRAAPSSTGWRR